LKAQLINFIYEEQAQDLLEYTLLMAFVCLTSAALFVGAGTDVSGTWTSTNSQLTSANTAATN
jgi:Flp pilus assembly pilin Flp